MASLIDRRKMMANISGSSKLPSIYLQVEWIRPSAAGAYINTGIINSDNVGARIIFHIINNTADGIYGTVINPGRFGFGLSDSKIVLYYNGSYQSGMSASMVISEEYTLDFNYNNSGYIDLLYDSSVLSSRLIPLHNTVISAPTILFGCAENESASSVYTRSDIINVPIHQLIMTLNDITVRDLIPCYHKETLIIGMYDRITKEFFPNAGSGSFVIGPNIN